MAEVSVTEAAEVAVPVERAFDYRLDFRNLPNYNPNVSNFRRVDGGSGSEPGAGAEYLFDLTLGGATAESPIRVLEADRPRRIVFETGPGYMAREVCAFTPSGSGARCEFTITVSIPGEIDDQTRAAIEATSREQLGLEMDLMKKNLEG